MLKKKLILRFSSFQRRPTPWLPRAASGGQIPRRRRFRRNDNDFFETTNYQLYVPLRRQNTLFLVSRARAATIVRVPYTEPTQVDNAVIFGFAHTCRYVYQYQFRQQCILCALVPLRYVRACRLGTHQFRQQCIVWDKCYAHSWLNSTCVLQI